MNNLRSAGILPALFLCICAVAYAASPYTVNHALPAPVVFAPGISSGDDEAHVTFTPDGKTLYFIKDTPNFNRWTICISHFVNGRWSPPEVAPFSGQYNDADVFITRDGNTLFFVSDRPVSGQPRDNTDIWMMKKSGAAWSDPQHIDELSSPGNEWFPTAADNGTIYFGSERRPGNKGPEGTADLWRSRYMNGHYSEPENLGDAINTASEDIEAYVAPNESYIIFSSKGRKDTHGSYDLYVSYKRNGKWSEPQNLGDVINSKGWEFGAKISPDGKYLFFTSNRGFTDTPLVRPLNYKDLIDKIRNPGNGLRDIYQVDVSALHLQP
jgi:Tol biopolymer transport system component